MFENPGVVILVFVIAGIYVGTYLALYFGGASFGISIMLSLIMFPATVILIPFAVLSALREDYKKREDDRKIRRYLLYPLVFIRLTIFGLSVYPQMLTEVGPEICEVLSYTIRIKKAMRVSKQFTTQELQDELAGLT